MDIFSDLEKTSNIQSANQSNCVSFKALSLLNLTKINTRNVLMPSMAQLTPDYLLAPDKVS